jgi:hypothetical protein
VYWIARSSRATTALIAAAALPSPSFFLGALATKQSSFGTVKLDCFAKFIIGRRIAPTRWLAMTKKNTQVYGN